MNKEKNLSSKDERQTQINAILEKERLQSKTGFTINSLEKEKGDRLQKVIEEIKEIFELKGKDITIHLIVK